ncbi:TAP domain-containing protein [Coniochaeta sp. PMI_546]|nr:TAP domain-containing protein [Coniochaeta sp. PMI_546]
MLRRPFSFSIALALATAAVQVVAEPIQWQSCTEPDLLNSTAPLLCGNLSVPLDYTNANSSATVVLQLVKASATSPSPNGSIIFNFGGPGEPDRLNLAQLASYLLVATGGGHDLISFDTRGTYNTLPFLCYADDVTRAVGAVSMPTFGRSSETALGAQWANGELFAENCYAANNLTGSLIGTAFIARDVMQIVDALSEEGQGDLLNYWGFSYGTLLGATVAAMFPDRMGKVILDGVVNPFEYYHGYEIEKYVDTDKVFSGFVKGCVSAPENCALAGNNATAARLEKSLYDFLTHLKYNPLVLASTVVDYSTVKGAIVNLLYSPGSWPLLASGLHGIITRNTTEVLEFKNLVEGSINPLLNEFLAGIQCGDKAPRASDLTEMLPFVHDLYDQSKFSDIQTMVFSWCANWRFEAKERYAGDFHVKTRNPVLIIGNTYDPVTPLASALNVSHGFEGSVVLQHDAYGHTSIQQISTCTLRHTQAFFANGTLPSPGTVCEPSVPLFGSTPGLQRRGAKGSKFGVPLEAFLPGIDVEARMRG